ncbi:unnamed protein product, partial [Didymodactylos carnosus]
MYRQYGDYYHTSFGPIAHLVIADPSLMDYVLKKNSKYYHKSVLMEYILGSVLGMRNLLLSEDDMHKQHRKLIQPLFHQQNIVSMENLMIETTNNLLDEWTKLKSNSLDIHCEMIRLTLDIVAGCVFGTGLINNHYVHDIVYKSVTITLNEVENRAFNMLGVIPILKDLPLPSKLRIEKSKRDVKVVIKQIIKDRKDGQSRSACKGPDLLDLLLSVKGDFGQKLSDDEVFEQALTF